MHHLSILGNGAESHAGEKETPNGDAGEREDDIDTDHSEKAVPSELAKAEGDCTATLASRPGGIGGAGGERASVSSGSGGGIAGGMFHNRGPCGYT